MDPDSLLEKRRQLNFSQELAKTGWYHTMELPGGRVIQGYNSLEDLRSRWAEFSLPADLHGKRLLDIGAWDGWFTFEAERRGAEVVAVDHHEQENFHYAHRELASQARYEIADVYNLLDLGLGRFDYVLFLGVLYHLRHPLLALDIVCELTKDIAIVDSFVAADADLALPLPAMEFYETTELAEQLDNWFGPTLQCLMALCRSAGFARTEYLGMNHQHARIACYRRWEPPAGVPSAEPLKLKAALNSWTYGVNFTGKKEEYVTCWFDSSDSELKLEDFRPGVSGYGAPPLALRGQQDVDWHITFRLPPGLETGWHDVRIRTTRSDFSNAIPVAIRVPVEPGPLRIAGAGDSTTWQPDEVGIVEPAGEGYLTLWIEGLPANADRNNLRVDCDGRRLPLTFVSPPQINAIIPKALGPGKKRIDVECSGVKAPPVTVIVKVPAV